MRRTRLGVALGFIAAIAFAGNTQAFTGPTNGSFEDVSATYVDGGGGFQQLDAPNTSIGGWSIDSGSVDWSGADWAGRTIAFYRIEGRAVIAEQRPLRRQAVGPQSESV